MFKWLKSLLSRVEIRVVEMERTVELPTLTAEMKESLRTLQVHPGFQYLARRMALEKAALQHSLHEGFNLPERELHHLQAGIHFAGWFEREIARLTQVPRKAERAISEDEQRLFSDIKSSIELIG